MASFAAFALQLMVNAAPPALLSGAMRAGDDEVRHAEQCFALASRDGPTVAAREFPRSALASVMPQSLADLADAALREGGVAETLSVLDMAAQLDAGQVVDADERAVLLAIVRDETRHAALAWRTVTWASRSSGDKQLVARLFATLAQLELDAPSVHKAAFASLIRPLANGLIAHDGEWRAVVQSHDVELEPRMRKIVTVNV